MGFRPPASEPMTAEEAARNDRCRPFIQGSVLSITNLKAHTIEWTHGGKFVKWCESEQTFNAWRCWAIELNRDVILLFGHSPFYDNADYGSCNQYFWIDMDVFERIFLKF